MAKDKTYGPLDDRVRYEHIRTAALDLVSLAKSRSRDDLETDMMLARAMANCITWIGEAASRLSPEGRALAPSIPWPSIVRMRNFVVHSYWVISNDRLWEVASTEIHPLIEAVDAALVVLTERTSERDFNG